MPNRVNNCTPLFTILLVLLFILLHLTDHLCFDTFNRYVEFILMFQTIMFYVPNWLWKTYLGETIQDLTKNLENEKLTKQEQNRNCDKVVRSIEKKMKEKNWYGLAFFSYNFLNLCNVIGQIVIMNLFFGNVFSEFGTNVIFWSDNFVEDGRNDRLIEIFPRQICDS